MKYHLLTAGCHYYPESGTGDWIKTFETREEIEKLIEKVEHTTTFTKGKNKGQVNPEYTYYTYNIIGFGTYDWYQIIDLRDWIEPKRTY